VFTTIVSGTLLLALPMSRTCDIPFLDLLFTATSVTCVTGLFTVPLECFSTTGHVIILILSQIGGIGLVTLTIFLLSLFMNFGFASQLIASQLLHFEGWKNIRTFIAFILGLTLCVELFGALCFFCIFVSELPLHQAVFLSLFNAVASFCNTGITLPTLSASTYNTSIVMSLTATVLMIFGSLGFVTWNEIVGYILSMSHHKRYQFSLQSKIILYGTVFVISATLLSFLALEWHTTLAQGPTGLQKYATILFQVVSFRSAGFMTPLFYLFRVPTLLLILFVAFIGGSPGSTSGGVKITTITILIATIRSAIKGRFSVEIRGRSIPIDQVYRALAIISLSVVWICMTTFLLTITEAELPFKALFFEASSAFSNLGMSLGITESLSAYGKIIIMASMIIGRIGSLTLILALKAVATRRKQEGVDFSYPEERVILS
jgi:trk system potassium uptake protein TrkH